MLGADASCTGARPPSPAQAEFPSGTAQWNGGAFLGNARIHDIQGRAHLSPFAGKPGEQLPGIVTLITDHGFYLQDPAPDADDRTSEALFVFTKDTPNVAVGDALLVSGVVAEFRNGCSACTRSSAAYANLTITELQPPLAITWLASGQSLPPPTVIGRAGRIPPASIVADPANSNVESAGHPFDPSADALAFFESLEGMRVEIRAAVSAGPTTGQSYGIQRLALLTENEADVSASSARRTQRGAALLSTEDATPERLLLTSTRAVALPCANVGDSFAGPLRAIVDYGGGNYTFLPAEDLPRLQRRALIRDSAAAPSLLSSELSLATFNVENLDAHDSSGKFAALARIITEQLHSPDLIALEEVQDDSGDTNDGVVSAVSTLARLRAAIAENAGPHYEAQTIDPTDGADGGAPGGNIRQALLIRSDRGLALVQRPGAIATTTNRVIQANGKPRLAFSPGRVDPDHPAFIDSRKPLAAELTWNGKTLFVVANHFISKTSDEPSFGRFQPPRRASSIIRTQQASVIAAFVSRIRELDPSALIAVLGDLNDSEFSRPVLELESAGLTSLTSTLPADDRYTYIFEGNALVLDHVLVSPALRAALTAYDIVHINSDFCDQISDHDPVLARFTLAAD